MLYLGRNETGRIFIARVHYWRGVPPAFSFPLSFFFFSLFSFPTVLAICLISPVGAFIQGNSDMYMNAIVEYIHTYMYSASAEKYRVFDKSKLITPG